MDIPVSVQNRKENFKSPIFSSMNSSWCILSPMPHKTVIFDPLMQGHEMSYFLKLIAFLYSSYLYHVSLFFLVTQKSHSNPLSQRWLFGMCEHQTCLAYCRGMKGLKVTSDTASRSDCTLCHNHFLWILHMDWLDSYVPRDDWLLKIGELQIK